MYRVLINCLIAVAVLFLPWWLTIAAVISLLVIAEAYEVLAWGVVMDSLYAAALPALGGITFLCTLAAAIVLALSILIKPQLMVYDVR